MEKFASLVQFMQDAPPPPDGWFFYTLTICLFVAVCGIVYTVFKWFVIRLDKGEERKEEYFKKVTEAITELQKIVAIHELEIENIKDKVFPVWYTKKRGQ